MIWVLIAAIATIVGAALILPVIRGRTDASLDGMGAFDGQLEELARDRELGLIAPEEARAAELEIRRRQAQAEARSETAGEASPVLRQAIIIVSSVTVMAAVGLYMLIGSPQFAGEAPARQSAQMPEVPQEVREVLDQIDALASDLMANPDNPRGWAVLGESYIALGRYAEAAIAFENAIDGVPDSAYLFASLGQAYLFGEGGDMTPRAREAFARALDIDPADPRARFFMAEARFQDGETQAALAEWQALLDDAPADASYRPMVEARIRAATDETGAGASDTD